MFKATSFALLSCITALTCSFVSAQTQPDVCKDAPSQADWNNGTNPVYADANALTEELKSHGIEVECVRRSKQENVFEGQKGAAWFQSKQGVFEVLFLPSGKDFSGLTITEKQNEGLTTYSFSGNPKFMLKSMQSVKHLHFIKHKNFLFEVLENDPLTILLKGEFEAQHMDNQEEDPRLAFESAYENGKVKPVTAAALKAIAQMAARIEQMKATMPDLSEKDKARGFMMGQNFFKDTLQDNSDPHAVLVRNMRIYLLKQLGRLEPWTHDGILEDKVYEVAAVCEMGRLPEGHFSSDDQALNLVKFIEALKSMEK